MGTISPTRELTHIHYFPDYQYGVLLSTVTGYYSQQEMGGGRPAMGRGGCHGASPGPGQGCPLTHSLTLSLFPPNYVLIIFPSPGEKAWRCGWMGITTTSRRTPLPGPAPSQSNRVRLCVHAFRSRTVVSILGSSTYLTPHTALRASLINQRKSFQEFKQREKKENSDALAQVRQLPPPPPPPTHTHATHGHHHQPHHNNISPPPPPARGRGTPRS